MRGLWEPPTAAWEAGMTMTVGVGTFPFMPPEVMRDAARQHDEEDGRAVIAVRHRYDGRAVDVYSLAITLIQMWTCKPLYPGAGAVDVSCWGSVLLALF